MVHAENTKTSCQKKWITGQADQRRMYGGGPGGEIRAAIGAVQQPVLGDVAIHQAVAIHLREMPKNPKTKPGSQRQGKQDQPEGAVEASHSLASYRGSGSTEPRKGESEEGWS